MAKTTLILLALLALLAASASASLKHSSVIRTLDLTSQVAKETVNAWVVNEGTEPAKTYTITHSTPEHVSYIDVKDKESKLACETVYDAKSKSWTVTLPKALEAGGKVQLLIFIASSHVFKPLPTEVAQLESQFVKWTGLLHFTTPYTTTKAKTVVVVPSNSKILSKSDGTVTSEGSGKFAYGVYNDIPAYDKTPLYIHFENNAPFITVNKLVRTLEVSHWGNNLAVDDAFTVTHTGAKLKGTFSRIDHMKAHQLHDSTSIVQKFKFSLPVDADDVYYWDIIGNISTSNLRHEFKRQSLEIEPRFPLFGGWHTEWAQGFNQPLSSVLYHGHSKGSYILKVPFAILFDNAVVDDFTFKVVLPEGAVNIQFHSPSFAVDSIEVDIMHTYLDSYGRPVFIVKKSNVVDSHAVDVFVTYDLPDVALSNEPFLLLVFFMTLFTFTIIYVRIDLTIAKDAKAERREQVREIVFAVVDIQDDIKSQLKSLENAIEKLKTTKDKEPAKAIKEQVDGSVKASDAQLEKQAHAATAIDKEVSKKIEELRKLNQEKLLTLKKLHIDLSSGNKGVDTKSAKDKIDGADKQIDAILEYIA